MAFDFFSQAICKRQIHEGCCIKLPSRAAFVDRSSDWPSYRMSQDWRDLLRKPMSNTTYIFLMDRKFGVYIITITLLGVLFVSVIEYFLSRGSEMGFYINDLPSGPFVSMDYIWVPLIAEIIVQYLVIYYSPYQSTRDSRSSSSG